MVYKFIDYINNINEGLLNTTDYNIVISKAPIFLDALHINYNITTTNNTILLDINNFNTIHLLDDVFNCIESFFINMNGWLPSTMYLMNISGMTNNLPYNKKYLKLNSKYLRNITIKFESRFDIEVDVPSKLYHLSIKQFRNQIEKSGLFPKDKSKLSLHPSRIYLCSSINLCKTLIAQMNMFYSTFKYTNPKSNINDDWIIYEINTTGLDLKLYKDPNFNNGYFIHSNIPKENIKIIEQQ